MRARYLVPFALVGLVLACGGAPTIAVSPAGQPVDTGKAAPPLGSRNLGPIDASNGSGCGLLGVKGSYESALADLRNRAGDLGGNYVQIESVTGPHDDSGCTTAGYAIHGIVFLVSGGVLPPVQPTPAPAAPPPPSAVVPAIAAPPPPSPPLPSPPPPPAPAGVCDPPCSPGFVCRGTTCIPVCNPPCEANEVCSRRRTCEPSGAPAMPVDAGVALDGRAP